MGMIRRSEADKLAQNGLSMDLGDLSKRAELLREEAQKAAERIIADAKAERQRLISDAAEIGRSQGHAEGFTAGRNEGLEQGRAEAADAWGDRFAAIAEGWTRALEQLDQQREVCLREAEHGLLELGVAFARRVAHRAVELDPSPACSQVRAALERAAAGSVLAVRVHPDDVDAVKETMSSVVDAMNDAARIVSDTNVKRGACSLDLVNGGGIDVELSDQLDRLVQTLLGDEDSMESAA